MFTRLVRQELAYNKKYMGGLACVGIGQQKALGWDYVIRVMSLLCY